MTTFSSPIDTAPPASAAPADASGAEDGDLVRKAAELTRDLAVPRPWIYWLDYAASAGLGYGALAVAMTAASPWIGVPAGVVATLALYRALIFIHELTHLKPGAVPGFRTAWNVVSGIPLMVPSFMYEGVHSLHHARTRYGTAQDPEYLPLAHMKPWTLAALMIAAVLAPLGQLIRYGLLSPLSLVVPGLRKVVVERFSSLAIDPAFRRDLPTGRLRRDWLVWETATSLWALLLIGLTASGILPVAAFAVFLAVLSAVVTVNQVRTLAAHLWENEGQPVSVTRQYLDSVNVPPPGILPALWAPVGLRYHALHHLLPGMPYHALDECHRRLSAALPKTSAYHQANYPGLAVLTRRLMAAQRSNL